MNEKEELCRAEREISIRAVERGLEISLELFRCAKRGSVPMSEEDKANLAQIIKNMCATVCEYVDNHNS